MRIARKTAQYLPLAEGSVIATQWAAATSWQQNKET
jgi:hypothetical protein